MLDFRPTLRQKKRKLSRCTLHPKSMPQPGAKFYRASASESPHQNTTKAEQGAAPNRMSY